jgi:hypothetical protein
MVHVSANEKAFSLNLHRYSVDASAEPNALTLQLQAVGGGPLQRNEPPYGGVTVDIIHNDVLKPGGAAVVQSVTYAGTPDYMAAFRGVTAQAMDRGGGAPLTLTHTQAMPGAFSCDCFMFQPATLTVGHVELYGYPYGAPPPRLIG